MPTLIMDCFGLAPFRLELIRQYFAGRDSDVQIVSSNWDHFKKQRRVSNSPHLVYLPTLPYYKNISVRRMVSHWLFARSAFAYAEKLRADTIYTHVPPNSMAHFARRYKEKHPETKMYLGLIDLWPESMPIGAAKKYFPFTLWRAMRDKALAAADIVTPECDLYKHLLRGTPGMEDARTLRLVNEDHGLYSPEVPPLDALRLCYLGSVNTIIDIPLIASLIKELSRYKKIELHIIGDGQSRDELLTATRNAGAQVFFYGITFDTELKREIYRRCHFGLNITKPQVCVGLTMKSIDYFEAGLPLLNNIGGDTWNWVEEQKAGFNITAKNTTEAAKKAAVVSPAELMPMRQASRAVYDDHLSVPAFTARLHEIFDSSI